MTSPQDESKTHEIIIIDPWHEQSGKNERARSALNRTKHPCVHCKSQHKGCDKSQFYIYGKCMRCVEMGKTCSLSSQSTCNTYVDASVSGPERHFDNDPTNTNQDAAQNDVQSMGHFIDGRTSVDELGKCLDQHAPDSQDDAHATVGNMANAGSLELATHRYICALCEVNILAGAEEQVCRNENGLACQLFGLSLKDSPLLQTSHGTEFTEFTNARTPSEHNSALHDVIPNPTSAQANNPTTAHCADLIPNHSQENVHFDFDFGELVQMPISDPNDPRPSQESSSLTRTSTTVCSMWAKEIGATLLAEGMLPADTQYESNTGAGGPLPLSLSQEDINMIGSVLETVMEVKESSEIL